MARFESAAASPVFRRYTAIRQECYNPRNPSYSRVGGRGITCYWTNSRDFSDYVLSTLGPPPQGHASLLTRIDLEGNFEPGNLKWSDSFTISNRSDNCIRLTYRRRTRTISEWSREYGISSVVAYFRYLRGWTFREIFITQKKNK